MFRINENYLKLNKNYLFSEVAKRTAEFKKNNPDADITESLQSRLFLQTVCFVFYLCYS